MNGDSMPLNPPPVIESSLLLVKQQLIRSDMSRAAEIEYALICVDSTLATYQDTIDDFQANFNSHFATNFASEVTLPPPTGRGGDGTNVPLLVVAAGAAAGGSNVDPMAPPNVACLVRKRTSLGGRRNRGRTYFPFNLRDADVSENGTIAGAEVAALQTEMTAFLAQLVTDNSPMVIENRTFNTPLPPHFVTNISGSAAQVTSYTVESIIATQRRRLNR
jgi:hypothetical protein